MIKPKKQEIFRLLTIIRLLYGHKKTKEDIVVEIANSSPMFDRQVAKLYFPPFEEVPFENDNDPDDYIGKALRYLEKENITNRRVSKIPGIKPGRRNDFWWLIRNHETLYKIFNFIKQINFTEFEETDIRYRIFKSEYCQNLININIVNKLNNFSLFESFSCGKNKGILEKLNDSEMKFILKIIKISPTALDAVLNLIYDADNIDYPFGVTISEYIKTLVIFNFLTDLRSSNFPDKYAINYKIEINLPDEPVKKDESINREEYTDYSDGLIIHEVISSVQKINSR